MKGVLLILLVFSLNSQLYTQSVVDQEKLFPVVLSSANAIAACFKSRDFKGYINYIHPSVIENIGGQSKMTELLNRQKAQLKNNGVVINDIVFNAPTEIIKSGKELQCTISQHTDLKSVNAKVMTYTTFIAISNDNGKNWMFVDTSNMDISVLRKLLPNLSNKIILPPKQKPTVYPLR